MPSKKVRLDRLGLECRLRMPLPKPTVEVAPSAEDVSRSTMT